MGSPSARTANNGNTSNQQQSSNTSSTGEPNSSPRSANNSNNQNNSYINYPNSSDPNGNGNDEDGDEGRQPNQPSGSEIRPPSAISNNEPNVQYVEYENLAEMDLNNYDIFEDSNNEVNLVDLATSDQYIVLPENWRESDQSFYFAEEDIDFRTIDVYQESASNRKYILDKKTNRKYYLVSRHSIKKLNADKPLDNNKRNIQPSASNNNIINSSIRDNSPERVQDSNQVFRVKHEDGGVDESEQLDVDYVEEFELEGVDLDHFEIEQDGESGEISLVNSNDRRQYWIVLPNGWRIAENLPYINEEDISLVTLDFYIDARTKRKYVIDDKTGQRYYIIPNLRNGFKNFVEASGLLKPVAVPNTDSQSPNVNENGERQLKSALKKPKDGSNQTNQSNRVRIGDQVLTNFDSEPSNAQLRAMSRLKPNETVFNPPPKTPVSGKPEDEPVNYISQKPSVAALFKPANFFAKPQPGKRTSELANDMFPYSSPLRKLEYFGYRVD
jgi:hypothetical protein